MTITTERTGMRTKLRSFIRETKYAPFSGKEELVQERVDTEINALLAGFASDEEKLVALNNFKIVRGDFIDLLNNNFSKALGELADGNNIQSYINKGIAKAKEALVIPVEE